MLTERELAPELVMPLRAVVPENAGSAEEMAARRLHPSEKSDTGRCYPVPL
jgi:hypothetical protein